MKKLILLICLMSSALLLIGQTVYETPITELESPVIIAELHPTTAGALMGVQRKTKVRLDLGQFNKITMDAAKAGFILDEKGKVLKFSSVVDFILMMESAGYEYKDRVAMSLSGNSNAGLVGQSILFRRKTD